jgi:hypothetical protein
VILPDVRFASNGIYIYIAKKRKECKNYKVSLDGDREMRIADKKGKQMQNKITKKSREEVCGNFQRHFSQ